MLLRILSMLCTVCCVLSGCKKDLAFQFKSPKKLATNQLLTLSVEEKNNYPIDSVTFLMDGKEVARTSPCSLNIEKELLGKHTLTAVIHCAEKIKKQHNSVYFLAQKPPKIFRYEVINRFPHDPKAFTQGLEYHNGFLYESTGIKGQSSIRKTVLKTGEILQIQALNKAYFGEGITLFDEKIYQLTWQAKKGFVYDLKSFQLLDSFAYGKSEEGWGLTHNEKELIKSDGTERLWFLDPETLKETHYIEAYTNKRKAERLNEIEYINGKIYANIWQKNTLVIIDPKDGTIEGVANLNPLANEIDKRQSAGDFVLNGIAYDPKNERLFVTGKNWNFTFEIRLIEK